MLYVAREAYLSVTGKEMPNPDVPRPREPAGQPWDEESVAEKYPELAATFGFK
jgi:hypothetical protein